MKKMTENKNRNPRQKKKQAIYSLIYETISDILLIALYRVMVINYSGNLGCLKNRWFVLFLSASIAFSFTIRLYLTIDELLHDNNRPQRKIVKRIANDYDQYQEQINLIYRCRLVDEVQVLQEDNRENKSQQTKLHICRIATNLDKLDPRKKERLIVYYDLDKQVLFDHGWLAGCYQNFKLDFAKSAPAIKNTFPNSKFAIDNNQIVYHTKLTTEQDLLNYLNVLNENVSMLIDAFM